jgi:hypothetical protein
MPGSAYHFMLCAGFGETKSSKLLKGQKNRAFFRENGISLSKSEAKPGPQRCF